MSHSASSVATPAASPKSALPVSTATWIAGASAALLLIAFAWPILALVGSSLVGPDADLSVFGRILTSQMYQNAFFNTFFISGLVTLVTLAVSYPLAYMMATVKPATARLLVFVVLLPFWTSALVRTTAWWVLLQRNGVINGLLTDSGLINEPLPLLYNLAGVLIGMVHVLLPFAVLPLYAAFRSVDQGLVAAAQGLGASRLAIVTRILLPLTLPGAVAGSLIVFMSAIGTFITPALMGGPKQMLIAQAISYHMQRQLDWQMASALSLVLLLATLALFLLYYRVFGFERLIATDAGNSAEAGAMRTAFGHARWPIGIAAALVALFLIAPIAVVYPLSLSPSPFLRFPPETWTFRWFEKLAADPKWFAGAVSSLRVVVLAIALSVVFGTIAAIAVDRCNRRLRSTVEVLMLLPMIVPTIIIAVALYYQYAPLDLLGTHTGLAIGHALLGAPFVFITVRASLRSFDRNLELAALGLGASWRTMFKRVMLPALLPGIIAGAVFAFITSFDDVVLAIFLTNAYSRTLPRVIYEGLQDDIDPAVVAVAAVLITLSTIAFLMSLWLQARQK